MSSIRRIWAATRALSVVALFAVAVVASGMRPVYAAVGLNTFDATDLPTLLTNDFQQGLNDSNAFGYESGSGIGDSDYLGTVAKSNVWTSRQTIEPDSDESYVVSGYFFNSTNSGYAALGVTTSSNISPTSNFVFPESGLGILVHGGGGGFVNNTGWATPDTEVQLTWDNGGVSQYDWYYMQLEITQASPGVFDMEFKLYDTDSTGVVGSLVSSHTMYGVANSALATTPAAHAYFGTTIGRFDKIDNFSFSAEPSSIIPYTPPFTGGAGTSEDPWLISNCAELQAIDSDSNLWDDYYLQDSAIDCSPTNPSSDAYDSEVWDSSGFRPIASAGEFSGHYDGGNYAITDVFIDTSGDRVGLFAEAAEGSLIENTNLVAVDVSGDQAVGSLVGVTYGTVENAVVSGTVHGSSEVGGLVGGNNGWDTIINSTAAVDVFGDWGNIGGLVGTNHGNIYGSSASGSVNGVSGVGGLIGYSGQGIDGSVTIEDCSATGTVTATEYVGGLIGAANDTNIYSSFANGTIIGQPYEINPYIFGGLVGYSDGFVEILQSYYEGTITGGDQTGGLVGYFADSSIAESYAITTLPGAYESMGGLAGTLVRSDIVNSYASAQLEGDSQVGGLAGEMTGGSIVASYATGQTTAEGTSVGGFVGAHTSGDIDDSFSAVHITATEPLTIGGFAGTLADGIITNVYVDAFVTGRGCGTTSVPESLGSIDCTEVNEDGLEPTYFFDNTTNPPMGAGPSDAWDFVDVWTTRAADYPCLQWQGEACSYESYTPPYPDLNGDGIDDIEQANIGGYINIDTNKIVAMDVGENCELTVDDMTSESSLAVADVAYEYDNDLFEFAADCTVATTTIKLYYYDVLPDGLTARKFSTRTNSYFTLDDAVIEKQTINGHTVTVVTYALTDNSERDMDLEVGSIEDPAGLARNILAAPNTGLPRR